MNNINNNDVAIVSSLSFDMLMRLKDEHHKIYEAGAGEQMELLNYLYDILDNINSEIIKQNKLRIKTKYGSLLPPNANRNRGVSQQQQTSNDVEQDDVVEGDNDGFQPVMPRRLANIIKSSNGQQKQGRTDGRKSGRGRVSGDRVYGDRVSGDRVSGDRVSGDRVSGDRVSGDRVSGDRVSGDRVSGDRVSGDRLSRSGNGSYNQPYRPESERANPGSRTDYKSGSATNTNRHRLQNSGSTSISLGGGVLSRLMGVDKVKMAINREMNKLSSANMDAIAESITDVFASWLLDELNNDVPISSLTEKFAKYLSELWTNLISKSLAQENMSEVYFKFLQRIMNPYSSGQTIMACLRAKSPVMAGKLGTWQPGFYELAEYKCELLDEINTFLNQADYFESDQANTNLAEKVGGAENLVNIQQTFSILGLFAKYFIDVPSSGNGRNRIVPSAWDIMLLAIYSNFKLLNELLYWEPVNLEEVERRVFFTVGFLENNRGFIQSLDTDFYRDIECQLDSIKRCVSIPASVKYKLFDCIDNFILMRKSGSGQGARK